MGYIALMLADVGGLEVNLGQVDDSGNLGAIDPC